MALNDLLVKCRNLKEEYSTDATTIATLQQQSSQEKKIDQIVEGFKDIKSRVQKLEDVQRRWEHSTSTPMPKAQISQPSVSATKEK